MKTYISMLRGINVSGQKQMRMEALRQAYEKLNLRHVRSYVQSGNVVFESEESDMELLAGRIEAQIEQAFGLVVPVFLREAHDFQRIIAGNPFLVGRSEDPGKLHVTFLYRLVAEIDPDRLRISGEQADEFVIGQQEVYLFCPNGYGKTKLTNTFFENKLKQPATTRNWRTITALYEMAKASESGEAWQN